MKLRNIIPVIIFMAVVFALVLSVGRRHMAPFDDSVIILLAAICAVIWMLSRGKQ